MLSPTAAAPAPKAEAQPQKTAEPIKKAEIGDKPLSPAVRKIIEESKIDAGTLAGTGKDGRLTKGDVLEYIGRPAGELE